MIDKSKNWSKESVFNLYLFVTISFVVVFGIIEIVSVNFIISQHENEILYEDFKEIQQTVDNFNLENFIQLGDYISKSNLRSHLRNNNFQAIQTLSQEYLQETSKVIRIYDKNFRLVDGELWPNFDQLIKENGKSILAKSMFTIIPNINNLCYLISIYPVYNESIKKNFLGMVVQYQLWTESHIHFESDNIHLLSYPINPYELEKIDIPINLLNKLNTSIIEDNSTQILRLNKNLIIGIKFNKSFSSNSSSIFVTNYQREFNIIARQKLFIGFLIILAFIIFGHVIIGIWFSAKITNPIYSIINNISNISNHPDKISNIENKYSGLLGEIVDKINIMNKSIFKYYSFVEEYKILANNLEQGFFGLDDKFEVALCNASFVRIFNKENFNEVVGCNIRDFIPFEKEELFDLMNNNREISKKEIKLNEKKYIVHNVIQIKEKERLRIIGTLTDVTLISIEREARERVEMELIQSNRLAELGARVEGVIHNINSPLHAIFGRASLLGDDIGENEDLERIKKSAQHINRYVKGILSKSSEDSISMIRKVDITNVVKLEIDQCVHNLFFKHNVKLYTELEENIQVLAVHSDISQCVANLLNNAIDSLKDSDKKEMKIISRKEGDFAIIEISDTGKGIKKENLKKIFEPSFSTKKTKISAGFGLGLTICKNIVDKYHGKLEVESIIGIGTKFVISLPVYINEDTNGN